MKYDDIYECFKDDSDLLKYFDPLSTAADNEQASREVYSNLVDYANDRKCKFVKTEMGYVFYAKSKWFFQRNILISFCLKNEYRNWVSVSLFWQEIKKNVGKHFICYLYTKNTRAIGFLLKGGMKIKRSNNLVTLLSI
jgi:hypothetical protein